MAGETLNEMSTYREIFAAAESVQKAMKAKAAQANDDDQSMHAGCAAIDAERACLAIGVLVDLYESESPA